jgi:hypothetical protein
MLSSLRKFSLARRDGGKAIPRQLLEALQLRLSPSPLGISEYFEYGIWHRSITPALRDEVIGWRQSGELDKLLNDDYSRVLANDKLLNYLVLCAAGYPVPLPVATYTTEGRRISKEIVLRSHDEVEKFLQGDIYPVYVKPVCAGYGRGVMGLCGKEGDAYRVMDGRLVSHAEFMAPFSFSPYRGMIFQKPLIAHPSIVELTGSESVSCVRFICFVTSRGPVIHTAFWKIIAGRNMIDNFAHGSFGNCLGAIDLETGAIGRAIARMGPGGLITQHPTTNKPLRGFVLPDWSRAKDLVLSASRSFPGLRLQNWDVTLGPEGPVLLELNTESELNVPQAISGRGFRDAHLLEILDDIRQEREAYRRAVSLRDSMH